MATKYRIIGVISLAVVGSLGWAMARDVVEADDPIEAKTSQVSTPAASEEGYLLLTNGQLVRGVITENDSECLVQQRVGIMRFPKKRVEGAFQSVRAAYEFRRAQLPKGDFDEGMKLAMWCLNLKMTAEANELLTDIVTHNPTNKRAKAMLVSLDQAAARAAVQRTDPEVRQARADTMDERRPAPLDSAILTDARKKMGISDLPVIFDLPTPLAIKRTAEFVQFVHPILQTQCARCHDGHYEGAFQLVPIKTRADRTPDALRANLDATLRLVDPNALAKSELLSSTLRQHGSGAKRRPIFPGSNDPRYKILASWVNSLVSPKTARDGLRAGPMPDHIPQRETFAADRNRPRSDPSDLDAATGALPSNGMRVPLPADMSQQSKIPPPSRVYSKRGSTPEIETNDDPQEFPLPFVITGAKPKIATPGSKSKTTATTTPVGSTGAATSTPPGSTTAASGRSAKPGLPANTATPSDKTKDRSDPGSTKKASKPLVIDPTLLEKALKSRNVNRQNPPAQ
jgi:hypothetical protein